MSHRFIGDTKGERDRCGHLLEAVALPAALCKVCGATPDDPECLCTSGETFEPNPILLIADDVATPQGDAAPETGEAAATFDKPEAEPEAPPADNIE